MEKRKLRELVCLRKIILYWLLLIVASINNQLPMYYLRTQMNCGSKTIFFLLSNAGCNYESRLLSSLGPQWLVQWPACIDGQQIFAEWFYQKYDPFSKISIICHNILTVIYINYEKSLKKIMVFTCHSKWL